VEGNHLRISKKGHEDLIIPITDIIKVRRASYMFYKIHYIERTSGMKKWVIYYWDYNPPLTRQKELQQIFSPK
jgi:hypothetical protein